MAPRTDTKERIGRAALALFVERGIAETSIRDITAAVGITEGALYRHYRSKEELAWALYGESFEAFADELARVRAGETGFAAEITAMVRTFCRFFDRDPDLFSYLLLAQHSEAKKVTSEMKSPVAVLRHCIIDGQGRGEVRPGDPEVMTAMLLGMVLQTAVSKIYGKIDSDLSALADEVAKACVRVAAV